MSTDARTGTSIVCSVAPMLSVRGGARAVEFYMAALGALEVYRMEDPSGSVVSRLSVDGAEFWLADESPEHGNFSPETVGGGTVRMILTVDDPDAAVRRAGAGGARAGGPRRQGERWGQGRGSPPLCPPPGGRGRRPGRAPPGGADRR